MHPPPPFPSTHTHVYIHINYYQYDDETGAGVLGGGWGLEDKFDVMGQGLYAGTALREKYLSRRD